MLVLGFRVSGFRFRAMQPGLGLCMMLRDVVNVGLGLGFFLKRSPNMHFGHVLLLRGVEECVSFLRAPIIHNPLGFRV